MPNYRLDDQGNPELDITGQPIEVSRPANKTVAKKKVATKKVAPKKTAKDSK